jgi:predicted amidohydrolase
MAEKGSPARARDARKSVRRQIVVTAVQVTAIDGEKDGNVEKMMRFIDIAGERGSDICVLPEMWTGIEFSDETGYREIAEPIPGSLTDEMASRARKYGMYISGSMYEAAGGDVYYNAAPLISPDGEILGIYRKTHLFDAPDREDIPRGFIESSKVKAGGSVDVYATKLARVGLSICSDLRFPELYRELALKGAEIMTCSSAFLSPRYDHWEFFLRARACENQCFLVAAGQYGKEPKSGLAFVGRSMVVDPWGTIVATASDEEGVVTAHVDLGFIDEIKRRYPLMKQRRPELYPTLRAMG